MTLDYIQETWHRIHEKIVADNGGGDVGFLSGFRILKKAIWNLEWITHKIRDEYMIWAALGLCWFTMRALGNRQAAPASLILR